MGQRRNCFELNENENTEKENQILKLSRSGIKEENPLQKIRDSCYTQTCMQQLSTKYFCIKYCNSLKGEYIMTK